MTFSNGSLWMTTAFALGTSALAAAQTRLRRPATDPHRLRSGLRGPHGRPGGTAEAPPGKALSILRGARSSEKATMSAGSLSGAIADEFTTQGYKPERISREAPLPTQGWLVTGIFYAIDSQPA